MKKILLFCITLFWVSTSLFAYQNSLKEYSENPYYQQIVKDYSENVEEAVFKEHYDAFCANVTEPYTVTKTEYFAVRYYADHNQKDLAKEHVAIYKKFLDQIPEDAGLMRDAADCDYANTRYYVHKDLSIAMDNQDLTKKLLKHYPEEAYAIKANAWRLIFTPQIAGGSNKNAINMLLPLLEEKDILALDDIYSCYTALVTAYCNKSQWKEAKEYIDKATAIYYLEPYLVEYIEKVNKKLK